MPIGNSIPKGKVATACGMMDLEIGSRDGTSVVHCCVKRLAAIHPAQGECDRKGVTIGDIRHHHIELIESNGAGCQPRIGKRGGSLFKENLEWPGEAVVLLHHLAGGNGRCNRPDPDAINNNGVAWLGLTRGNPGYCSGWEHEGDAIRK